jgi:Flp pilus assembly pilin Flp
MNTLISLVKNDAGQGLVEYAIVIALVSIVGMASLKVLGKKASNTLSNAASHLS